MATETPEKTKAPAKAKAKSTALTKGAVELDDEPVVPEPTDPAANSGDGGGDKDGGNTTDEAIEILEPLSEPRRWIIGKPPEEGGDATTYSIYVQKPLSYMARMRFFSLVSRTIAEAMKQGGSIDVGGATFDANEDMSMAQRVKRLREQDFASAGNFMLLAMNLIAYSPGFLLECYCLWLDVPAKEKRWAKQVMEQPHDPERDLWGLTEDDGLEMVEVFIDQNYEDIRRFFAEKLPQIAKRVQQRENERKGRASTSAPSKQ